MKPKPCLFKLFLALTPLTALPCYLFAAPNVIFDSGQTQSLARYQVIIKHPIPVPNYRLQAPEIPFPVKTPELTPGKVNSRRINYPFLDRPFFIIGTDQHSLAWLQQHASQLRKRQATGIIVNIDTAQQLKTIRQLVPELAINPLSGSKLAKQLAIQHYPVLVSPSRIEQ